MFDIYTIRRMNAGRVGAGRENALTRAQVAARYGVTIKDVHRAANNSWRIEDGFGTAWVHIRTEVVREFQSGAVVLDSDGWETVTTKDRLNRFQHIARVWSDRGEWRVTVFETRETYPFRDGMVIQRDGRVTVGTVVLEPLPDMKAIRLGNRFTLAIELWGRLSGYFPGKADDSVLFAILDKIEAEGVDRVGAWDFMDPHVRMLGEN